MRKGREEASSLIWDSGKRGNGAKSDAMGVEIDKTRFQGISN